MENYKDLVELNRKTLNGIENYFINRASNAAIQGSYAKESNTLTAFPPKPTALTKTFLI